MPGRRAFLKGLLGAAAALVVVPTLVDAEALARASGALPPRRLHAGAWSAPTDDDRLAALVRRGVPIVGGDYLLHRPLVLDRRATVRGVTLRAATDFAGDTVVRLSAAGPREYVTFVENHVVGHGDIRYGLCVVEATHGEVKRCFFGGGD